MLKKKSNQLLLSLLFILIFSIVIMSYFINQNSASAAVIPDGVYGRNGEVYVMVGSGALKGVYASQSIDAAGNRQIIPGGIRLFPKGASSEVKVDPANPNNIIYVGDMDTYKTLAVDQYRNLYVLSSRIDPGLIKPPANSYCIFDPPVEEGVTAVGADSSGNVFFDIINYIPGQPQCYHGNPRPSMVAPAAPGYKFYWDGGNFSDLAGGNLGTPPDPPAAIKANYAAKYGISDQRQIKRITGGTNNEAADWYLGLYPKYNDHRPVHYGPGAWNPNAYNGIVGGNWQRKWNWKIQRVNVWINSYIDQIPSPTVPDNGVPLPQAGVERPFEQVYYTTNVAYKLRRQSACGEFHGDSLNETDRVTSEKCMQSLAVTGGGRRYSYSSMPYPTIKKGTVLPSKNGGVINYGVPLADSAANIYFKKGAAGVGSLINKDISENTIAIGAATRDKDNDWVYAAPDSEPEGQIVDFSVADQWDGKGGVLYRLIQPAGDPKVVNKIIKWDKYNGYSLDNTKDPEGIKHGKMSVEPDVKCIASDGRGGVFWVTDARVQYDDARVGAAYTDINGGPLPSVNPPLPAPVVTPTGTYWSWKVRATVPASTELWYYDYYNKSKTKLNSFRVGTQLVDIIEEFSDAAGKTRSKVITNIIGPPVGPPPISDITLDLATVNIAGPPVGGDEKNGCDIVSKTIANKNPSNIKINDGKGNETTIDPAFIDEITEDKQYTATVENAPDSTSFSNDDVAINTKSGSALKDENGNGIKGGFRYSLRKGTTAYYWKVEMVEPVKKVITPDFPTAKASNFVDFPAVDYKGDPLPNAPVLTASEWYESVAPGAIDPAKEGGSEASSEFKFTPKEPGIYKISMMAAGKFYRYELMPFPSYITERTQDKYKPNKLSYLFFDDGSGAGGVKGDGILNGSESIVSCRYLLVTAQPKVTDNYVTGISITGPKDVNENEINTWTAQATFKFAKSFRHEDSSNKMETYDGIGVWDYPSNVRELWGLPVFSGGDPGENYDAGAASFPPNADPANKTNPNEKYRDFGEAPKGITPTGSPATYKTGDSVIWIEGVGTQTDPTKPLNKADLGCIEYEWYIAAENKNNGKFPGWNSEKKEHEILIARGRLSDEKMFADKTPVVKWSAYKAANPTDDRKFTATINLRYAFDMPLDPGRYFMYIKFKYPKLKWAGRSEKNGNTGEFAHYDLVPDGNGETGYNTINWTAVNDGSKPAGFEITVKDLQAPLAYFHAPKYDESKDANPGFKEAGTPAAGFAYKGGTTGDPFPTEIPYSVCDNNPNQPITSNLKALLGPKRSELKWLDVSTTEKEDKECDFTKEKVESVLKKTITPFQKYGVIQEPWYKDADILNANGKITLSAYEVNLYPGFGKDAPYRKAGYICEAAPYNFSGAPLPYDCFGTLPLYAAGNDGSGNIIGNYNNDPSQKGTTGTDEINVTDNNAGLATNEVAYTKSPACFSIIDNDSPTIIFRALRSRDNLVREFKIDDNANKEAYNDKMEWDSNAPVTSANPKLAFKENGLQAITVTDFKIDDSIDRTIFDRKACAPTQQMKIKLDTKLVDPSSDPDIGGGADGSGIYKYNIKFNSKNIELTNSYKEYSPASLAFYDLSKILGTPSDDTLELIENSRTRFEIAISDNVDGMISPSMNLDDKSMVTNPFNCYMATDNLGDSETLAEVMKGWRDKDVKGIKTLVTYGIFRNPTLDLSKTPYLFIAAKDKSGNATIIKTKAIILHTIMKRETINIENRRTE